MKLKKKIVLNNGEFNQLIGWLSLTLGVFSGLILGLWSFDGPVQVPNWIGNYEDTSRRLLRMGHISLFGVGILNILLAREFPWAALGKKGTGTAMTCMTFGNVFLPTLLFGAAIYRPIKYLLPFPALSIFVALSLAAHAAWLTIRD
jgi:hypothetical protein